METVKIEKGIPVPARVCGPGSLVYPWREMEVGDSFLIRQGKRGTKTGGCVPPPDVCKLGWKFVTRREGNRRRVWRFA